MAGHSKWANIKHRKAKMDAQKGKIFTKLAKEISVAAREGGGDPAANYRLNAAIQKAKASNLPMDNIDRAIKKGTGELGSVNYEEVIYEGYGPEGAAVMCFILTDNRNRTAGEIRHTFSRRGGNLGESGCVSWIFEQKGLIVIECEDDIDEDELLLAALESGAEDVDIAASAVEIQTSPEDLNKVKTGLEEAGYTLAMAEVSMLPKTTVTIDSEEKAEKMLRLIEELEDHEDVQDVYSNYNIPDEILEKVQ